MWRLTRWTGGPSSLGSGGVGVFLCGGVGGLCTKRRKQMSVIAFYGCSLLLLSCFVSVLGCALQTKQMGKIFTLALHWTLQN